MPSDPTVTHDAGGETPIWAEVPELVWGPVNRPSERRSRREALKLGASIVATAVAASTLKVLGSPMPATASGPGLAQAPGRNFYGSGVNSACLSDVGCVGTPADHIDGYFCSTCDEYRANHNNWLGFMFTGGRNGNAIFDDHPGRFCAGDYDYWVHDGRPCGFCPHDIAYRCHDGMKWTATTQDFVICHSVVICDGVHQSTSC